MKKRMLYSFLPLLVAMMMSVTFTACNDDDDPTENVQTQQTETPQATDDNAIDKQEDNKENEKGENNTNNNATTGEAIDLGLTVKWASYNVGATEPWEYGSYYAWGEIEKKNDYSWESYKWCHGNYYTMTKYCTSDHSGSIDGRTTLDPEDDVAHVKWGGNWRMPTANEMKELFDECIWEASYLNNIRGYKITGPSGKSIFLPSAGKSDEESLAGGFYWTSTLGNNNSDCAYSLCFNGYDKDWSYNESRCNGYSVRAVYE